MISGLKKKSVLNIQTSNWGGGAETRQVKFNALSSDHFIWSFLTSKESPTPWSFLPATGNHWLTKDSCFSIKKKNLALIEANPCSHFPATEEHFGT